MMLTGRNVSKLEQITKEIQKDGGKAEYSAGDPIIPPKRGKKQTTCETVYQTRAIYMGITDDTSTKVGKRAAERAGKVKSKAAAG
jgi:hypothetical protein